MDYCTFSPDGYWGSCCKEHDNRYDDIIKSEVLRLEADLDFRQCMVNKGGPARLLAPLYYFFVRKFGVHFYMHRKIRRMRLEKKKSMENINSL